MKKYIQLFITCVCMISIFTNFTPIMAEDATENSDIKILFTANLNNQLDYRKEYISADENIYVGGYSLLTNAIQTLRDDNTVVVDAGNFSTGSIFNSIFTTSAPSLDFLSTIGYDAINLGPGEYIYGTKSLATMIKAAPASPTIVSSNVDGSASSLKTALEKKEAASYKIIEKGNASVGVFGLIDREPIANNDKTGIKDPFEVATQMVEEVKANGATVIVCLWSGDVSKAEEIALNNPDIDAIVTCEKDKKYDAVNKVQVGNTALVFAQGNAREVGEVTLDSKGKVKSVKKHALNENNFAFISEMDKKVRDYRKEVTGTILKRYGLSYALSYASIGYNTDDFRDLDKGLVNNSTADLVTDAFVRSYTKREGDNPIVLSITTRGMITGSLKKGSVSVNDIFSLVNQGVGSDGLVGNTLIRTYIYGKDLRNLCELDCSYLRDVTDAQLYFGSMRYDYDENRMDWNKVEEVYVESTRDYYIPIRDDEVYPVIMNEKVYELLPRLIKRSRKNLSLTYYGVDMEEDVVVEDLYLHNDDGTLVKEWSAIAKYLARYEKTKKGYQIDNSYNQARKTKNMDSNFDPIAFFKNTNSSTLTRYLNIAKKIIIGFVGLKVLVWLWNIKWKKQKEEL